MGLLAITLIKVRSALLPEDVVGEVTCLDNWGRHRPPAAPNQCFEWDL